jgi:spore coat protein CotF
MQEPQNHSKTKKYRKESKWNEIVSLFKLVFYNLLQKDKKLVVFCKLRI